MEGILQGLPRVCVYLDDILVTRSSEKEHLTNLKNVLERLEKAGFRLKRGKCSFLLPTVEYLGHVITPQGLKPSDKKVKAIKDAPTPVDVQQLRSFLGLMNYYGKFLPNLSSLLAPLHDLLHKHAKWRWDKEHKDSFEKAKSLLTSTKLLVHFDPEKQLTITCDASPYGVGAVLSHIWDDGSERPIYYASRSLAAAEKKYSQLDKKGLGIIFAVKKFHQFLYWRSFVIKSDHKPLQYIFGHTHPVPPLASARIQKWALTLGAYNYTIMYKPGSEIGHADCLSRLPLPQIPSEVPLPGETILLLDSLERSHVSAELIKQWTNNDPILSNVSRFLLNGWPESVDLELLPYQRRKNELSVQNGCVLWGSRVAVPQKGQELVVSILHQGHPGISRMKSLARCFVWWPKVDQQLETRVKQCEQCQLSQHFPAKVPLRPWEWPECPWSRIHIDYAGPLLGKWFLLVVDAHSKWMEVVIVSSATSSITIEKLRSMFATHGLPETIVSDNGTVFTSAEFKNFTTRNCIRHIRTAPYHPSSNGQVERAVQTSKKAMKKNQEESLETRVSRFLFHYRTTPHSPAEMLMGRQLRSHLSLLVPNVATQVRNKQFSQKERYDERAKEREFAIGDRVLVRNFPEDTSWVRGIVKNKSRPLSFNVELDDGRIVRRHIDHIQSYGVSSASDQILIHQRILLMTVPCQSLIKLKTTKS